MKPRAKIIKKWLITVMVALMTLLLSGGVWLCFDRPMLRSIINQWGRLRKEKPEVYHEYEGYSPGANRSRVEEDFNRYHYYIAPDHEELLNSDPDIYFRQDYEAIEAPATFDEDQYWRENPLTFDDDVIDNNNENPNP